MIGKNSSFNRSYLREKADKKGSLQHEEES